MNNFRINIKDIPMDARFEGYLWWSDQEQPEVFKKDTAVQLPVQPSNPFVVEGNLFDAKDNISYQIKMIDGEYHVFKFNLDELKQYEYTLKSYLADINDVENICFREYWKPELDVSCENFEVLKPAMIVFVGFNCKEK